MAHIKTIKQKYSVAYQVAWNLGGAKETKYFSAGQYGTEAKAKKAAKAFCKKKNETFPVTTKSISRLRSNNISGINGLRVVWRLIDNTGYMYPYISVHYVDKCCMKGRRRAYSIRLHGLYFAIAKALKVRKENGCVVPSVEYCYKIFSRQLKGSITNDY